MQQPVHLEPTPPLLALPSELRDEIYGHLVLPGHVLTSSAKPDTFSLLSTWPASEAYLDTRIYLPARPSSKLLSTCRQLREEHLDFVARSLNSRTTSAFSKDKPAPAEDNESNRLAARMSQDLEEQTERDGDDGSIRITLEILRAVRGRMGSYIPNREAPSPRLMALAPVLSQAKRVKFIVWAGWDWWYGPPPQHSSATRRTIFRVKRTTPDQEDELLPAEEENSPASQSELIAVQPAKPDPLSIAINGIIAYLPGVEEINVDVLMHIFDYFNLSLPDPKWKGIQAWLEAPVTSHTTRALRQVNRKLIGVDVTNPACAAPFFQKLEKWEGGVIHVAEGDRELPETGEEMLVDDLELTRTYYRAA